MDKEIITKLLNVKIQLIKDDDFCIWGIVTEIYSDSFAFLTDGKTIFLNFNRVKEVRPRGDK